MGVSQTFSEKRAFKLGCEGREDVRQEKHSMTNGQVWEGMWSFQVSKQVTKGERCTL